MQRGALLAVLVLAASTLAQSTVVPAANANVRGTGQLNSIIRNAANPRTYQWGVNAAELGGIPTGSVITGVSLRLSILASNPVSWPPANITWSNYDIWVGPAIPTATFGADFFANFATPPQQVRTGPMTLDAGVYSNTLPVAPTPNAWGEFYFDFQVPFQYQGGDLAFLFSHPGSNDPTIAQYPETVASNAGTYGVGRSQNIYPPGIASAATTFYVMRVHYGFGNGCIGSTGTAPVLVQNANTTGGLGGTILLQVGNAPALTPTLFALGATANTIPIVPGCDLYVSLDFLVPGTTNALGRSVLSLPIPPGFQASVFAQAGVTDPLAPLGFTLTNAVSPAAF